MRAKLTPMRLLIFAILAAILPLPANAQSTPYRVDLIIFLNQATPNGAPGELSAPLSDFELPENLLELDDAAALGVAGVRLLPDAQFGLPQAWQRMRNARAFLPIERHAWVQRNLNQNTAPHLRLRNNRLLQVIIEPDPIDVEPDLIEPAAPETSQRFVFGDGAGTPYDDIENTEPLTLYQLDGTARLYSRRYLHLELDLRWTQSANGDAARSGELLPESTLRSFRLNETRRMRRDQLHYFDHPRFGVLARVSRVEPEADEQDAD